jgi:hypothetical protein
VPKKNKKYLLKHVNNPKNRSIATIENNFIRSRNKPSLLCPSIRD